MFDDKTQFLVEEVKGLLDGLEGDIFGIRYNLASDNVYDICKKLNSWRTRIDYIETRVNEQKIKREPKDDDEDEYI